MASAATRTASDVAPTKCEIAAALHAVRAS